MIHQPVVVGRNVTIEHETHVLLVPDGSLDFTVFAVDCVAVALQICTCNLVTCLWKWRRKRMWTCDTSIGDLMRLTGREIFKK